MGNSSSQTPTHKACITQKFLQIDKSITTKDQSHIICKVMYDKDHFSPSYIIKINLHTNKIEDKFFFAESIVEKMKISEDSIFLAIQSKKNFYVFNLQTKEAVISVQLSSSWFLFKGNMLFFRSTKNTFTRYDLTTSQCQTFLQFESETDAITRICVSENMRFCFYIASLKDKANHRIVKFDLNLDKELMTYKSSKDIKKMLYIDHLRYIVVGKYSDEVTIYTCETEIKNIKN